ncbi:MULTISPECIES: ketopantoate reductase family protein [Catenuloplanes]|uniref:2-dehydropantoate 2-reductase n=1 Tax=Catenuloplanes niger TaxID=587534 RepID=A0AAE3ZXA3_9ACTN|nr:2-dehydropantoate 2-reductase N-terminal domain-containing protein [Catenuloplanes niger]MDR7327723.1 2-dehydropantoate 2-reductase [Catenuloplanes niger]
MRLLVYGAGVLGSLLAADLHEAGHDVALLARGERLAALRRHGVLLAEGHNSVVRRVPVPVVADPADGYDLIIVMVRAHQVDPVLQSVAGLDGDVLFLHAWAAGAEPLGAVIGHERVLLGFPARGGTMDGDVIRHRPHGFVTRRVPIQIGEPDGHDSARVGRIVRMFRTAGISARAEPRIDAWLRTHATVTVPLGQASAAAGGPAALARDPDAIRGMLHRVRRDLADLPTPPVPRGLAAVLTLPDGVLVPVVRRFLRSSTVTHSGLSSTSPATEAAELERLADQMRILRRAR